MRVMGLRFFYYYDILVRSLLRCAIFETIPIYTSAFWIGGYHDRLTLMIDGIKRAYVMG